MSFRHPACYASTRGGCATKISREHTLSGAVLQVFANDKSIDLGGLSWLGDGERKQLPITAVASNVLCTTHNSELAPLDAVAGRFVQALQDIHTDMKTRRRRRPPTVESFDGELLERWLLKCLCGLVVSGTVETKGVPDPQSWRPPEGWLDVLFGDSPMPAGLGLYFLGQPGERAEIVPHFSFGVISNSSSKVYGLTASVIEKRFLLAMNAPTLNPDSLLHGAVLHPGEFVARNGINESLVQITWRKATGPGVVIAHDNPRRGAAGR